MSLVHGSFFFNLGLHILPGNLPATFMHEIVAIFFVLHMFGRGFGGAGVMCTYCWYIVAEQSNFLVIINPKA